MLINASLSLLTIHKMSTTTSNEKEKFLFIILFIKMWFDEKMILMHLKSKKRLRSISSN